jgi:lysyl-tRNA synthetase class I
MSENLEGTKMAVMAEPKRSYQPFWSQGIMPRCDKCGRICVVRNTSYSSDGRKIQYRYCPECGPKDDAIKTIPGADLK